MSFIIVTGLILIIIGLISLVAAIIALITHRELKYKELLQEHEKQKVRILKKLNKKGEQNNDN